MEKKSTWEEYSPKEKTSLLIHWFYYYSGAYMTKKEYDFFGKLAAKRQDDIFNVILTSFITQETMQSNIMVFCIRDEKTEELFRKSAALLLALSADQERVDKAKRIIVLDLVESMLKPLPDVNMIVEDGAIKKLKQGN